MMTKNGGAFRSQKGFTLVELMIVVIIIGILTAVGVVLYMGYVRDAKAASAQATIGTIVNAEKVYHQLKNTFVDVADFTVVPNDLNIDVRDATQYWTLTITGADPGKFTATAEGIGDYAGIKVTLAYDMAADEVWTKKDNGVVF